jgi:hypothetical protein
MARFKNRNVHTELQNLSWARNISNIDTAPLVEEFVMLFMALESQFNWTNKKMRLDGGRPLMEDSLCLQLMIVNSTDPCPLFQQLQSGKL